jgi:hypothetical protein
MLEPWIILQIRRREEEDRRRHERPQLELPVPAEPWPPTRAPGGRPDDRERSEDDEQQDDDSPKRGVVIIGI